MLLFTIRPACGADIGALTAFDRHIPPEALRRCVAEGRVLALEADGALAGWLRWGLFWDSVPFMNLLYVLEPHRGRGFGLALVERWERDMRAAGFSTVMTSSQQDEYAQHFYVKLGYRAVGGFTPRGDPLEILFEKALGKEER